MSGQLPLRRLVLRCDRYGTWWSCRRDLSQQTGNDERTNKWPEYRNKHKKRFNGEAWQPQKRLTRYQMDYLRTLKQEQPGEWAVSKLASAFGISVSAVLRILKSKWEPPPDVKERQDKQAMENRQERRKEARQQDMRMDSGGRQELIQGQPGYKKPCNKDLTMDFDM